MVLTWLFFQLQPTPLTYPPPLSPAPPPRESISSRFSVVFESINRLHGKGGGVSGRGFFSLLFGDFLVFFSFARNPLLFWNVSLSLPGLSSGLDREKEIVVFFAGFAFNLTNCVIFGAIAISDLSRELLRCGEGAQKSQVGRLEPFCTLIWRNLMECFRRRHKRFYFIFAVLRALIHAQQN